MQNLEQNLPGRKILMLKWHCLIRYRYLCFNDEPNGFGDLRDDQVGSNSDEDEGFVMGRFLIEDSKGGLPGVPVSSYYVRQSNL